MLRRTTKLYHLRRRPILVLFFGRILTCKKSLRNNSYGRFEDGKAIPELVVLK